MWGFGRGGGLRAIETNGVTLAVDDRGDGPAVVLLHGFPELAFSWRHQIQPLVDAGFRVISFDQRGYGTSSHPEQLEAYALKNLAGDVVGVLDRLGIENATIVGHDWGSIVAYTTAIIHPTRVRSVVSLNVPYRGACWGFPTMDVIRSHHAHRFGYIIMFHDGDSAEVGFAADPRQWLLGFYLGASNGRAFLSDAELNTFVDSFVESGITGPVNWYRNIDANAVEFASYKDASITQPTLIIAADSDPVLPLSLVDGMDRWVPDLSEVVIEDCGHWTQQEKPDQVNRALLQWLESHE
jgi:pimeloyl-ACP methyl ester carboxylesterase